MQSTRSWRSQRQAYLWLPYDSYCISAFVAHAMGALSLRLPEDLDRQLSHEAELCGQPRSQLIREALEALLLQRQRQRLEAALVAAAKALATNPAARAEALAVAADFLAAEDEALQDAVAGEATDDEVSQNVPWWR